MRSALRVVLLAALLAGCLGAEEEGPRLAQPTDTPAELPGRPNVAPQSNATSRDGRPTLDHEDPGFAVRGNWTVGDAWYYEANATPWAYRLVEVVGVSSSGGRDVFEVRERTGALGQPATAEMTIWVDAGTGARLRAEDPEGTRILWSPGDMGHWLYRNASATWNETGRDPRGFGWRDTHTLASTYVGEERVRLPWGVVPAGRVEHRDLVKGAEGERTVAVTRWISADLRYDVRYGTEDRAFSLVGARVDGREVGRIPEMA